jgi:multicomponent Na+:H+ antiporter subunit D
MLAAMALAAALCIGIGSFPAALYALLPWPVEYEPYTASHVLAQLQLLVFSALAFAVLMRTGIYPPELRSVNLDFDWTYRKLGAGLVRSSADWFDALASRSRVAAQRWASAVFAQVQRHHGPAGLLARTWPTGSMVLWVAILLASYLALYYF